MPISPWFDVLRAQGIAYQLDIYLNVTPHFSNTGQVACVLLHIVESSDPALNKIWLQLPFR